MDGSRVTHRCFACFENMARPGPWPSYEPDSAVRDMRAVAIAIGFLVLIAWGNGAFDAVTAP